MGFADLHIHSIHSYDGTASIPAILKYTADQTDLDVIAISDHDTIAGVKEAVHLAPRYGLEVIPACEVSTREGHLLTLFINQRVPAGFSLIETVLRVGQMGGLCVAPHPEARGTGSLSRQSILHALMNPEVGKTLAGIETFNGGLVYTRGGQVATTLAQNLDLAWLGNSDSHMLQTIGEGSTQFAGHSAADLRRAIEERATITRVGRGLQGTQALRQWLPKYILRKLGWVTWNAHPKAPIRYARLKRVLDGRDYLGA